MKLLLLDKDGSIVLPKSGAKFVNTPWDQKPIPGVEQAIAHYISQDWTPIIISNQGGVAAGHKTLETTIQEMRFCLELFEGRIAEALFCPDFEGSECWRVWGNCDEQHRIRYDSESWEVVNHNLAGQFRKPSPGMLQLAIGVHGAREALFVGDRPEDEGAAIAANIKFVWAEDWRNDSR